MSVAKSHKSGQTSRSAGLSALQPCVKSSQTFVLRAANRGRRRLKPTMESEAMTFEVPSRYLSAFIKMADACRHIDTTAEHVAAMLDSPDVDVVIALWRDPVPPGA